LFALIHPYLCYSLCTDMGSLLGNLLVEWDV
jgi:hypothetical protein